MKKEQYYSIEEVAKILKVTYLTVYRWVRSGKLLAYKVQKQYRITDNDFKLFMKGSRYEK